MKICPILLFITVTKIVATAQVDNRSTVCFTVMVFFVIATSSEMKQTKVNLFELLEFIF